MTPADRARLLLPALVAASWALGPVPVDRPALGEGSGLALFVTAGPGPALLPAPGPVDRAASRPCSTLCDGHPTIRAWASIIHRRRTKAATWN